MPNHRTDPARGLWRLLILDRDEPGDPRWLIATIGEPADVRPASAADSAPDEVTHAWVCARHGLARVTLTTLPHALAWRVDERQ